MRFVQDKETFLRLFGYYCYELGLQDSFLFDSLNEKGEFNPPFSMEEFINNNTLDIIIDEDKAIGFVGYNIKDDVLTMDEFFLMKPFMNKERIQEILDHVFEDKKGKFVTHLPKSSTMLIEVLEERFPSLKKEEMDAFAWIFETEL